MKECQPGCWAQAVKRSILGVSADPAENFRCSSKKKYYKGAKKTQKEILRSSFKVFTLPSVFFAGFSQDETSIISSPQMEWVYFNVNGELGQLPTGESLCSQL